MRTRPVLAHFPHFSVPKASGCFWRGKKSHKEKMQVVLLWFSLNPSLGITECHSAYGRDPAAVRLRSSRLWQGDHPSCQSFMGSVALLCQIFLFFFGANGRLPSNSTNAVEAWHFRLPHRSMRLFAHHGSQCQHACVAMEVMGPSAWSLAEHLDLHCAEITGQ